MSFEIKGEQAIIKIPWMGKEEEVIIQKMSVEEIAHFLDESLDYTAGRQLRLKVGTVILSLLPKCLVKAPFPTNDTVAIFKTRMSMGVAVEICNAFFALNEMTGEPGKEPA